MREIRSWCKTMKLVYTHENKILVENAKNILLEEGIECVLRNEFAGSGIGDLAPIQAWPELWVLREEDESRASGILAALKSQNTGETWPCQNCGEKNEAAFMSCWQCQHPKVL